MLCYLCFRPEDSVSLASSGSQCRTLASEVCEDLETKGSLTKSRFSSSSSTSTHQHRDKRAFFWNRALVRLRNSFRSGNKISPESSLPPRRKTTSAQENSACVRLSTTSTSVEEDFVWEEIFGWQLEIWGKILSTQCSRPWNTKSQMATRTGWAFVINISRLSQDTRRKAA